MAFSGRKGRSATGGSGRPLGRRRAGRPAGPRDVGTVLDGLEQAVLVTDRRWRPRTCNRQFLALFDLEPRALARWRTSGQPSGVGGIISEVVLTAATESPVRLELGGGRVAILTCRATGDVGWLATFDDASARHGALVDAERRADLDPLTGLPNSLSFKRRLREALATGAPVTVLCLDLDRFKQVNDTLGHAFGDALLRTVAERLGSTLRESDTLARLGGDEFAIIQAVDPDRPQAAAALATRLVDLVGRSYVLDGQLVNIGVSVGVASGPADGDDPDRLLRAADLALYDAKAAGRGTFRHFEPAMDARVRARCRLELDLRRALALRELELHYQPQLNLASGRLAGFEALLRWRHPERGLVPPAEFVPLAEEIGLIGPIGEWVLRTACREAAGWPAGIGVAVNLSPAQFRGGADLVRSVTSALAASGLPADRLELEITETVLLQDDAPVLEVLHRLRAMGVRVAMDDFGTGYSSLSYLRSFPFDKIKIDRSFVRELAGNAECVAIVRAIAGLGASLGMATIAEGVETAEQLDQVQAEGCSDVQGYLVSRPVPAGEVGLLIARLLGPEAVAA